MTAIEIRLCVHSCRTKLWFITFDFLSTSKDEW